MTTVDEVDLPQVVAIDHTEIAIETDLTDLGGIAETYSISDLRAIEDLPGRARAAAAVTRVAEQKADMHRSTRDMAGLVLIQPFHAVQRPYDAAMEKIDAALEAGKIKPAEARELRDAAKAERAAGMKNVELQPADVWRGVLGVSRGAFARMTHRATQQLPEFRGNNGQLLTPEQLAQLAINSREECKLYDAIAAAARDIRDDVVTMLLNGNSKVKRPPMSNADVARLTKLTTARVAQIRYGTR